MGQYERRARKASAGTSCICARFSQPALYEEEPVASLAGFDAPLGSVSAKKKQDPPRSKSVCSIGYKQRADRGVVMAGLGGGGAGKAWTGDRYRFLAYQ